MRQKTKLWLALVVLALVPAFSGAYAQQDTAKIHGHIQDPAGVAIANARVEISTDGKTPKYTFTADQNGDYKGDGIAPGTYVVTVFQGDKGVDRFTDVKFAAGQDVEQNFDMTRPEYVSKLTPEQKKALEELKQKNAEAMKENSQIKNLNADLIKARQDNKDKNYAEAESLMQKDTAAKPDAAVLWLELGVAQSGQKKYDAAAASLRKAIELDAASKKPNPDVEASANNALGEVLAAQGKGQDAMAAYDAAAKLVPANAGMYYTNAAIVMSRAGQTDATVQAADKAIAADPNKAIPYYLKGQALINKATVDPKTQKIVAPPGCEEAYQKYLELDPNGQFAGDARNILAEMGATVKNSYKAGKK